MDQQVLAAQQWLNSAYGSVEGWVTLAEDGITGWGLMYGLRRALQHELGISPVSSGFGPATTQAYVTSIGRIDYDTQPDRVMRILSCALWAKGYPGGYDEDDYNFVSLRTSVMQVRRDLGLGDQDPHVDVKLMSSLMSMDAYTKLKGGSDDIRDVQQWLNCAYVHRRDFELVPCDGVHSRQVQRALLFGLQYEIGMADGTANGNFGNGTREGLRQHGQVGPGTVDRGRNFVALYQASLRLNGYIGPLDGGFGPGTEECTRVFQAFMELPVTGRGDYSTWCSLLVSCGDTSLQTKGFDTNIQLTADQAAGAADRGYTTAGRYIVGANKFITAKELAGLKAAGLKLLPIHQRFNNTPDVMTEANGRIHGREALERCRVLGLPASSIVFFAVDFDALGQTITGPVCDYFRGVADAMADGLNVNYRVGVYGTRNVCTTVINEGLAVAAFVAGMSTGWSGNMGFKMPREWHYNQVDETAVVFASSGLKIGIDKDVVSSRAEPVDLASVVPPPVSRDRFGSATGFDSVFEWVVRGEVACERAIARSGLTPKSVDPGDVADCVLHWLQKPQYWLDAANGLWMAYTPIEEPVAKAARHVMEQRLASLEPAKPESSLDVAHFAVTVRGYLQWGVPRDERDYGVGDLGGWLMDLLQIWGEFERARKSDGSLDLDTFMRDRLGVPGVASGFNWLDVVADADAYLVARRMEGRNGFLSTALRDVLQEAPEERVRRFYRERFAGVEWNVATAFTRALSGLDVDEVNLPFTKRLLRLAANADQMPTSAEAGTCATAYARVLANA